MSRPALFMSCPAVWANRAGPPARRIPSASLLMIGLMRGMGAVPGPSGVPSPPGAAGANRGGSFDGLLRHCIGHPFLRTSEPVDRFQVVRRSDEVQAAQGLPDVVFVGAEFDQGIPGLDGGALRMVEGAHLSGRRAARLA